MVALAFGHPWLFFSTSMMARLVRDLTVHGTATVLGPEILRGPSSLPSHDRFFVDGGTGLFQRVSPRPAPTDPWLAGLLRSLAVVFDWATRKGAPWVVVTEDLQATATPDAPHDGFVGLLVRTPDRHVLHLADAKATERIELAGEPVARFSFLRAR